MAPYATPDDLAVYWRPLTDAERTTADRLLRVASAVMRGQVPSLDDRIAAGTLDPDLPRYVATAMVRRLLTNPENVRQQSAGPLQITYANAAVNGLDMSDDEFAMLLPSETAVAGTIMTKPGLAAHHRRHDIECWHEVH